MLRARWNDNGRDGGSAAGRADGAVARGDVRRLRPRRAARGAGRGGRRGRADRRAAGDRDRPVVARRAVHRDAARRRSHHRRGAPVRRLARRAGSGRPGDVARALPRDAGRDPRRRHRAGGRRRACPYATTRPSSRTGTTISSGRRAANRSRRSSTRWRGVGTTRRERPDPPMVLRWGDVRLGNIVFGDDLKPRAILDWDMAAVGAPEHDVAWFTMLDFVISTFAAAPGRRLSRPRRSDRALRGARAARRSSISTGTRRSRWSAAPRSWRASAT